MSKDNNKSAVRKRGVKELFGGIAIAAVGAVASLVSYNMAKAGETYHVYTSAIAIGAISAVKGIIDIAFPAGLGKSKDASEPVEAESETSAEEVKEED